MEKKEQLNLSENIVKYVKESLLEDKEMKEECLVRDCEWKEESLVRDCEGKEESLVRDCKGKEESLLRDCKGKEESLLRDCEMDKEVMDNFTLSIKSLCQQMQSKDKELCLEAVLTCDSQLLDIKMNLFEKYFEYGVVESLTLLIKSICRLKANLLLSVKEIDETILYSSSSCLSIITLRGESKHIDAVVEHGGIDIFLHLIDHNDYYISTNSLAGIMDISKCSELYRNIIMSKGVLPLIKRVMIRFWSDSNVLSDLTAFIENLCEPQSDHYPTQFIKDLFPVIYTLMSEQRNVEIQVSLTAAIIHSIFYGNLLDFVFSSNFHCYIISNLTSSDEKLVFKSVEFIILAFSYSDAHFSSAVDAGLIISIKHMFTNQSSEIVNKACELLRIIGGFENGVMIIINSGMVESILNVIQNEDHKIEAIYVIFYLIESNKDYPKLYLLDNKVFKCLVPLLSCRSSNVKIFVLKSFKTLLDLSVTYNRLEDSIQEFTDAGGISIMNYLQGLEGLSKKEKSLITKLLKVLSSKCII